MEHSWWIFGWTAGVIVVLLAASLLLIAIVLVRRVTGQAGSIITALQGARTNTAPLFDIAHTNHSLARIADALSPADAGAGRDA